MTTTRFALVAGWLSSSLALLAAAGQARANGAFPDAQSVLLPADRPLQIILAANFGLVFSDDGGAHWQYSCEAQATANGKLYALGAAPDDRLFSLSDYGVATSADMGCGWTLGGGPFDGGLVLDYFADPTDPARVLAVAEPPGVSGLMPAQVFESRDGGTTYPTVIHPGVASGGISGVEIARSDASVVYVTLFEKQSGDAAAHPRLARSDDRGATWETIDLEPMLGPSRVAIAAVDPDGRQPTVPAGERHQRRAAFRRFDCRLDRRRPQLRPPREPDRRHADRVHRARQRHRAGERPAGRDAGRLPFARSRRHVGVVAAGLHARGFGERGSTLYVAADDANDGFALASSEDDGDSWTPRLRFAEIESVRSCTQRECLVDCWQKVTQGLFPPPVCGQAPPTEPPGDGGPAAAATPGDGGCGACATARTSDASRSFCVAAIAIAGGVVVARRPRASGGAGARRLPCWRWR